MVAQGGNQGGGVIVKKGQRRKCGWQYEKAGWTKREGLFPFVFSVASIPELNFTRFVETTKRTPSTTVDYPSLALRFHR
ncbi:hypothetical protein L1987_71923 [Smallanthus sonchifolius]|uniref:Uncharacterized protein n=1 Tax=Smallanthus sonchifolius TaxID=185202 RepID=A0ACB9ATU0_9ASTR|nr:hypothetical protein L1987_71923 [Smallanthus sonchifolius]